MLGSIRIENYYFFIFFPLDDINALNSKFRFTCTSRPYYSTPFVFAAATETLSLNAMHYVWKQDTGPIVSESIDPTRQE